ncbi:polysaccharide pyruvyl transferase family protein [Halorubrum lipolyticum]|uniref:polysaccharide pyruvyl transferase family protein n=1 Tax=Halorubrum lipolyticum TaxID=368624 RepID=UPI0011CA3328|nr:polysaccharide pyruvyl transferase family protein [Halorubrum lipolyticum]
MGTKKIGVLHIPFYNVGEEVVYRGGENLLREAFPDATLVPISGYSAWAADRRERRSLWYGIKQKLGLPVSYDHYSSRKFADLYSNTDFDLFVAVGCFLLPAQIELHRYLFDKCKRNDTPIVLLGTGSLSYDQESVSFARDFLESYPVRAMITRDATAYTNYQDCVDFAHDGIDCGFFIDDWYSPPDLEKSFVAYTFDKREQPEHLEPGPNTVTASHRPYDDPFRGTGRRVLRDFFGRQLGRPTPKLNSDDLFISDSLREYLHLYKNAEMTHSDRIHACVPTLVYGGTAQLHIDTDRDLLFDGYVSGEITEGATIRREAVDEAKQTQRDELKYIRNEIV